MPSRRHRLTSALEAHRPALAWSPRHGLQGLPAQLGVAGEELMGEPTDVLAHLDRSWVDGERILFVYTGEVPDELNVTDDVVRIDEDVPGAVRQRQVEAAPTSLRARLRHAEPTERLRALTLLSRRRFHADADELLRHPDHDVRSFAWKIRITAGLPLADVVEVDDLLSDAVAAVGEQPWMHNLRRAHAGFHRRPYAGVWISPDAGPDYARQLHIDAVVQGNPARALPILEEALAHAHPTYRWRVHSAQAAAARLLGRTAEARAYVDACLGQARELGVRHGFPPAGWLSALPRVGRLGDLGRLLTRRHLHASDQLALQVRHDRARGRPVQADAEVALHEHLEPYHLCYLVAVLLAEGTPTVDGMDLVARLASMPRPLDLDREGIDELTRAASVLPREAPMLLHLAAETAAHLELGALPALRDRVRQVGRPCVGAYVLGAPLGQGGAATVFSATHRPSGQSAAVKVLHHADASEVLPQLAAEARQLATQDHPYVVPVHDSGTVSATAAAASGDTLEAGAVWIAMDRAEGQPLDVLLRRGGAPSPGPLLLELLDALAACHARDLVHCDLKPGNIMIHPSGRPRLLDLGLAKATGVAGRPSGTPAYMAPEQWRGDPVDARTDLYALGLLAYQLAHPGAWPPAVSPGELRERHEQGIVLRDGAPALRRWIERCIASHPADRFGSAAAAAHALRQLPVDVWPSGARDAPSLGAATTWTFADPPTEAPPPRSPALGGDLPVPASVDFAAPHPQPGPGLKHLAVRPTPLVGFDGILQRCWRHLVELADGGPGVAAVALTGTTGSGRRAVQRALSVRVRELGVARVGRRLSDLPAAAVDQPPLVLCVDAPPDEPLEDLRERVVARGGRALLVVRGPWGGATELPVRDRTDDELYLTATSLLPLEPATVDQLVGESRGRPERLVTLIRRAARAGRLVFYEGGYRLVGEAPLTPAPSQATVACMAAQRLEPIDAPTWAALCRDAHQPVQPPERSPELTKTHSGWVVHPVVRVSSDQLPAAAWRLAAAHAAVPLQGVDFLARAGDVPGALAALRRGLREHHRFLPESLPGADAGARVLDAAGVPGDDDLRAQLTAYRAWMAYVSGDAPRAHHLARAVRAGPSSWARWHCHAWVTAVFAHLLQVDLTAATAAHEEAQATAQTASDRADVVLAQLRLAVVRGDDIGPGLAAIEPLLDEPARIPPRLVAAETALAAGDVSKALTYAQGDSRRQRQMRGMIHYMCGQPDVACDLAVADGRAAPFVAQLAHVARGGPVPPVVRERLSVPQAGRFHEYVRRCALIACHADAADPARADHLLSSLSSLHIDPGRLLLSVPVLATAVQRARRADHPELARRVGEVLQDTLDAMPAALRAVVPYVDPTPGRR